MNALFERMRQYVRSLGGELGDPMPEPLCKNLPLYASAPYDFYKASLFGRDTLIVASKHFRALEPREVIAQRKSIEKKIPGAVIFLFPSGSKEFCQCLIKEQVPFAIPGRQMFFPGAMVAIREDKFNHPVVRKNTCYSPFAQVVLLFHLLDRSHDDELPFQYVMEKLKIHKVYVSRAAKELEEAEVAWIVSKKRLKSLRFTYDRRTLWQKSQDCLSSPVINRVRIANPPFGRLIAGVSALSSYSMLGDDADPTYAIYGRGAKLHEEDLREFSGVRLELWKYNPCLLSEDAGRVDRLSLYLSLRDNPDPRVAGELQEMMEAFEW